MADVVTSDGIVLTVPLNGKVERSHCIDAEEIYRMLDGVVVDDAKVFSVRLQG